MAGTVEEQEWANLLAEIFDKLTQKHAAITYEFDNLEKAEPAARPVRRRARQSRNSDPCGIRQWRAIRPARRSATNGWP